MGPVAPHVVGEMEEVGENHSCQLSVASCQLSMVGPDGVWRDLTGLRMGDGIISGVEDEALVAAMGGPEAVKTAVEAFKVGEGLLQVEEESRRAAEPFADDLAFAEVGALGAQR